MQISEWPTGKINLKTISDYILDASVSEQDTILLNGQNYEDIILEYRDTYNEPISIPFYLLRVHIVEDKAKKTPINKIGVLKNDPQRFDRDYDPKLIRELQLTNLQDIEKIIYRCGRCGNIVNSDGSLFSKEKRNEKVDSIYEHEGRVVFFHVHGDCCYNRCGLVHTERKLYL